MYELQRLQIQVLTIAVGGGQLAAIVHPGKGIVGAHGQVFRPSGIYSQTFGLCVLQLIVQVQEPDTNTFLGTAAMWLTYI